MKLSISISALFLLFFLSCREQPAATEADYVIVPPNSALPESTRFSELLEEYRYIIPETTNESLFSHIYKAYVDRGELYIFDRQVDKILVFDVETGKFLRSIGSLGRGPNEYISLASFTLDRERRELLAADATGRKVVVYDADSGAFKRRFEVGFYPSNIEYVDENTLACFTSRLDPATGQKSDYRLHLTDRSGNPSGSWIPSNEKNSLLLINSFSRGDGGEVIFRTHLSDSLYTVTPQGPVFSRFVDFGADALTWEKFSSFPRSELTGFIEEDPREYRGDLKYYSETGDHIWFVFSDRGTPCCTVYDKKTSETFNYPVTIRNDIVFDQTIPLISASDENCFIGTNDAYSIVESIEQSDGTNIPEDLKALSIDNNPVITFLKFK